MQDYPPRSRPNAELALHAGARCTCTGFCISTRRGRIPQNPDTPHKEFWGPRPCIWFRIPTERSEAKRCDGCDDSGTTCEADLGRRTGARGRGTGTGQGRVRGGSQDRRPKVLPHGGCALAASDQWRGGAARCKPKDSWVFKSEANAQTPGFAGLRFQNART